MARVGVDHAIEVAARGVGVARELPGELERIGRTRMVGLAASELEEQVPGLVALTLPQRDPRERQAEQRRVLVLGELEQHPSHRGRGSGLIAGVIRGFALQQERGRSQVSGQRRAEQRRHPRHRLGEVSILEIDPRELDGRALPDVGARRRLLRQLVLGARVVAIALAPERIAFGQQHPGANLRRDARCQDFLSERPRLRGLVHLDGALHQRDRHGKSQRGLSTRQLTRLRSRAVPVARCGASQREAGLRPVEIRIARRSASRPEIRREGLDAFGRLAGEEHPPAEAHPTGIEQRGWPTLREPMKLGGGRGGIARAAERVAVPEQDVARQRSWRPAPDQVVPRLPRRCVIAEAVERQTESVPRPSVHRRRHAGREHAAERVARARNVPEAQRRPPARVRRPHLVLVAGHARRRLPEHPVRLLHTTDADERFAEPVPGLDHQVLIAGAPHRRLQRIDGLLVFALDEAVLAAFERL